MEKEKDKVEKDKDKEKEKDNKVDKVKSYQPWSTIWREETYIGTGSTNSKYNDTLSNLYDFKVQNGEKYSSESDSEEVGM